MTIKSMILGAASFAAGLSFADLPDPVAWWTMDEFVGEGLVKDVTGNGYDFQSVGSDVRFEEGPFGHQAIRFGDTKQAWASVKAPDLRKETARTYTVSMWLRLEKDGGQLGPTDNSYPYLYNNFNGDRFHVTYNKSDSAVYYLGGTGYDLKHGTRETWNFVTLTIDGEKSGDTWSTRVVGYVNGVSQTDITKTQTSISGYTTVFMLGNYGINDAGSRPINAAIADLRIYDSVLTADQIRELYADSVKPRKPRLIAYWPMDEIVTSGSTRKTPVVGHGFSDMTLGSEISSIAGVHGKAIKYGMTNDSYGQATCLLPAGLGSWSFAAWIKNPYVSENASVRVYEWYDGNRLQFNTNDKSLNIYCNVGYGAEAPNAQSGQLKGLIQREGWSHLAVSYSYSATRDGTDAEANSCDVTFFVNGQKVETMPEGLLSAGKYLNKMIAPQNASFQLGGTSNNPTNPNACNGAFDDVCIFAGALTEDEAAALYNGAKPVDAGADFAVTSDCATLRGEVIYDLAGLVSAPEATNVRWELVSAPEGGESASIRSPSTPMTEVTLPVEGAYVFKLVSPHRFLPQTDTVTVTRRAQKVSNTPPTLIVTAPATANVETPVMLGVTATDGDGDAVRTSVCKVSGPDGVWFDGNGSAAPRVKVAVAGKYVLRVTAEDGETAVSKDVSLTVTDANIAATINDKRIHYWGLNEGVFKDEVSGTAVTMYNGKKDLGEKGCFAPGLVGYGFHAEGFSVTDANATDATGGYSDYRETNCTLGETPTTAGITNTRPTDQWKSISLWMKLDSAQAAAYDFDAATLIGVPSTFRLDFGDRSNANGPESFSIYQQGAKAGVETDSSIQYTIQHFTAPEKSVADRWVHVCVLLDRWGARNSQIWVDGESLDITSYGGQSDRAGRAVASKICIGGWAYSGNNNHDYGNRSKDGTLRTRAFPGVIDEVQIWNRKLSETEIAYLAANPCPIAQKRAPSVDAVLVPQKAHAKAAFEVDLAVYTDGLPSGENVTYAWTVLEGDVEAVIFSNPAVRKPTITITKAGIYRLQLAATDDGLTALSEPIVLNVTPTGLLLIFR